MIDQQVEQRLLAAQTAVDIPLMYAKKGMSLATAALAGASVFRELVHHPRQDVIDSASGARFYYHAHRHEGVEHGHFHLFRFVSGQAGFHHLAALSLNARGWPIRWFTTNEWVTGESWLAAHEMNSLLCTFRVRCPGRLAPLARWLTAMVQLYQPQLKQLLAERDRRLTQLAMGSPGQSPEQIRQNRQIDVLSVQPVDLPHTISALQPTSQKPNRFVDSFPRRLS